MMKNQSLMRCRIDGRESDNDLFKMLTISLIHFNNTIHVVSILWQKYLLMLV